MNIFYLDEDPRVISRWMLDKHIVKMPLESAQMLSTAKRLLDGKQTAVTLSHPENGKPLSKVFWLFPGEKPVLETSYNKDKLQLSWKVENAVCYQVAHAKHPSTVWTLQSKANYEWHFSLFKEMLCEFTSRYGKRHSAENISDFLEVAPENAQNLPFAGNLPQAMPDKYKNESSIIAYRQYYVGEKWRFAKWKHDEVPPWFFSTMKDTWNKDFPTRDEKLYFLNECFSKKSLPMDKRVATVATEILTNV